MAEKSVLAYFNTPEQAQQALEKMNSEFALIDSSIDRFDGYPGEGYTAAYPVTGNMQGLGALTLDGAFGRDSGILAAASTSASGLSSGAAGNYVSGMDTLLVAVVQEENRDRAMEIAQEFGAL
ncbi:hypothetical protein [Gorillibacterium massiliense]|uniref:hypothetical protein n=1 Tax=Gorillibacterium massiliense TaxID=1280390 RepID=UPI0004BA909E|nr:hypothetical protein [Gorillibacterium massiliense]